MGTKAISGSVLVVDACADTEALLGDAAVDGAGLGLERADSADSAIERLESSEAVDVVLLSPKLADPVRIAQRLHSLDRQGAVVILSAPERETEVRHALDVAPFLDGDIVLLTTADGGSLVAELADAAARTQDRRRAQSDRKKRRDTPPPLSARYLGTLLDSAPIGIVTLDAAGGVIGWNKRAGEMLEVSEVEALGTPFVQLFAEDDRERLTALVASLDTSGIGSEGQVYERSERAFELTGAQFAIRSGEIGTLLILQEVSQRIRAERELGLQRALLEAQAESSIAGIAIVGVDGKLERINRRWTEIWGIDSELIRTDREAGRRAVLAQVENPAAFMAGLDELEAHPDREFHDELRLNDGRTIERYGAHVRTADGEIVGKAWFHTDISDRKREEDALRFLSDATNVLSSSLDYETTLRRVAQLSVPRIADWCSVEIGEPGKSVQMAVAHADPEKLDFARRLREQYAEDPSTWSVATVMRTGESQVSPKSIIVPIRIRTRVFGAITFTSVDSGHVYDDADLRLAEELARRAAISIDNSRVHGELRETVRTLQESLLPPHLPEVGGVELAARFRPAGAGMQVGGDFYDIFDTGEDAWCIAVGDVCGKGAEAAALTALTRYTVRAAAMYEQTAGGVLGVLNRALLRQRGDFRFTTLALCMLHMADGARKLRVASGGHPRPLLLRPDGSAEAVGSAGPLLGVVAAAQFGEDEVPLEHGDVIVLYTDGLTDAHAPEVTLDEDDLLNALKECGELSAGEIALHMERTAIGDSDAEPRDDMAIVVVKIGGG